LLATSGHRDLPVFTQPLAAILCTGSELVDSAPLPGQIISGNRSLLAGLIQKTDSTAVDIGTVADDVEIIADKIAQIGPVHVIITTGGMGPGKYDLIREVCSKMGIKTIYHSLNVRPGRATLFGVKENVLFFGLPGPPPAAYILFEELIRPALLALQGVSGCNPTSVKALLQEEITVKKGGIVNLKNAILYAEKGKLCVRPQIDLTMPSNAAIYIPANRRKLRKGELVTAHCFEDHYWAK
jgi:molybdopterin molybdotransferase